MKSSDGDGDDDGNENGKRPNSLISNNNNKKIARPALSFVHFFAVVLLDHYMKLSSYTFYGKNVVCALQRFCCSCSCSLIAPFGGSLLSRGRYFRNFTVLIALLYCVRLNKLLEFLQK